jgi:hypothetical protein
VIQITFRICKDIVRAGKNTAQADVVVDGIAYRGLILKRQRRGTHVLWPKHPKLARSTQQRIEPKIIRALDQWRDLAGGSE